MIGNQPPSNTFSMLAMKKACSSRISGTISSSAFHSGQRQYFQMTKKAMAESITMVAVTEMP